jgi:hypothetical protein
LVAVAVPPEVLDVAFAELVAPTGGVGAVGGGVPAAANVTIGEAVDMGTVLMWPVMVAVPAVVEVKLAVYVPLPTSVTVPTMPRVLLRVTVSPPVVRELLFMSFAWTVSAEIDVPLGTSVVGFATIVVVAALAGPGVNVTVGETEVIGAPPMVPVMVAVPTVVGEVKRAE